MHFYILFQRTFDDNQFKLWLNHYNNMNANYGIYVEDKDIEYYKENYPLSVKNIISSIPEKTLQLTEKDFLFSYTKSPEDIMILSNNVGESFHNEIQYGKVCIGRLFYVPVKDKLIFSTFEIPDFIIYRHENHTNFTIDGLKINGGGEPSHFVVCLNMNISKVAYENEYYETNIIIHPYVPIIDNKIQPIFFHIIYQNFMMNVIVNKEKQYGIIWHPKCACTSITNIFCEINNIDLEEPKPKRSLNFHLPQYRYNIYLQNIELISFVRNPYTRFLSSYIDKHVYKTDDIYITLAGFLDYRQNYPKDCMFNLCDFISKGGYISDHYRLMMNFNFNIKYYKELKPKYFKIEENLNENLYAFLKKYHPELDKKCIIDKHDNSICNTNNSKGKMDEMNRNIQHFDENQWKMYLERYNINYTLILDGDFELKEKIYSMFETDFKHFGYQK